MGRCVSISYGLDDPNSVVVIGFNSVKLLAVSLQAQALKCILWLLCLFSGVLAISTDLMCCLEKKKLHCKIW